MKEGFKVTYRGVEVPEWTYDITTGEDYQTWAGGVDAAFDSPVISAMIAAKDDETGHDVFAYRYFHDGDETGARWWRRVPVGQDFSTEERYEELAPFRGWQTGHLSRSMSSLIHDVEVPAYEVPEKIR